MQLQMDNIFYKGLEKTQKVKIYKDKYILKSYREQFSPACAAAVVSGSLNGILGIDNSEQNNIEIQDVINIFSKYFKDKFDESKKNLEYYTGNNFDKLLLLIKKILKKKKIIFGTKKTKKIPIKYLIRKIKKYIYIEIKKYKKDFKFTNNEFIKFYDNLDNRYLKNYLILLGKNIIENDSKFISKMIKNNMSYEIENVCIRLLKKNIENNSNFLKKSINGYKITDFINSNYNSNFFSYFYKWDFEKELKDTLKTYNCYCLITKKNPSTSCFGNWSIKYSIDVFASKLNKNIEASIFMSLSKESKIQIKTNNRKYEMKYWKLFKQKFREKNSNLIFHLKNHYCHIFALRQYYDKKKKKNVREVLISKKGQRPKDWVPFKYIISTLLKWIGYAIISVDLID
jgi:hypothetical protein